MSKKLIVSTQCRRCLKPLTWVEVLVRIKDKDCSICNDFTEEPEIINGQAYHVTKLNSTLCTRYNVTKKLLNKDLCKSCLDKDEKKAKRIKRVQRKIGMKATRKKKTQWKDKKPVELKPNEQLPVFYLKRRAGVIYTKYSPKERWKKTSVQKLSHLERNYLCRGNPDN